MHTLYFNDSTGATYGTRYLDKGRVGNVYGTTLVSSFYVNGHASSNFKFNMEFESSFVLYHENHTCIQKLRLILADLISS